MVTAPRPSPASSFRWPLETMKGEANSGSMPCLPRMVAQCPSCRAQSGCIVRLPPNRERCRFPRGCGSVLLWRSAVKVALGWVGRTLRAQGCLFSLGLRIVMARRMEILHWEGFIANGARSFAGCREKHPVSWAEPTMSGGVPTLWRLRSGKPAMRRNCNQIDTDSGNRPRQALPSRRILCP
jgi:hypothetical protein